MTTEEKAREYDKALESAREWCKIDESSKPILEDIFKQLRENESEDERIRKEIIDFILDSETNEDDDINRWLAWLEKQASKSKWTEEDDDYLNDLESYFINLEPLEHKAVEVANWLKSLKQRMEE